MIIVSVYNALEYIINRIYNGKIINEFSYKYNNITYDFEIIYESKVIDNVLDNVSNDQSKFLILVADEIKLNSNIILTPKYPKKSLIIVCPKIYGTGTISMSGKGPNVLPEDILLFSEKDPYGSKLLIPAYANNAKTAVNTGKTTVESNSYINRKGNNGTEYNCGSGGCGGVSHANASDNRGSITFISGSGYSYGGGAGTGGHGHSSWTIIDTSQVDPVYPMRGGNHYSNGSGTGSVYVSTGGIGNPSGTSASGMPVPAKINEGVGGRLIIFCENLSNLTLKSEGGYYSTYIDDSSGRNVMSRASGGSSGGGSINIFCSNMISNINTSVISQPSIRWGSRETGYTNTAWSGGAGGNGTVTIEKLDNSSLFNYDGTTRYYTDNSNIFKDSKYVGIVDYTDLFNGD